MKRFFLIIFFSFHSYLLSIDPNLMYNLGSVKEVPVQYNPVIGLSFLKFGMIQSWLESSSKDALVQLTHLLFQVEGQSVVPLDISYLTPEAIGYVVKIISDNVDNLDQAKQIIFDYFKTLPEFKDVVALSADVTALLNLMIESLKYVASNTLYPQGSVETLLLAYLCAISTSRDEIQEYFQGFLDDASFVLPSAENNTQFSKKSEESKVGEQIMYKNYFCSVQQSKELHSFIHSFANKKQKYDALQNFVLLFFNFKDGNLIPNKVTSSLMNYIDVEHLGTMMRMIQQYNNPDELSKELQSYLIGLKIKNRVTGKLLDAESFHPLLIDLSESLQLTQGKKAKYSHAFFETILDSCVCSRLHSVGDIENYCKGYFTHVTDSLIDAKKKEFACCLNEYSSGTDDDKYEKKELWELEFEHGHSHHEEYDINGHGSAELLDEMVERSVLFDLQNAQVENSLEAVIAQLAKMKNLQGQIDDENQSSLNQLTQNLPFSMSGFYNIKNKLDRQKLLQQETEYFKTIRDELKNIDGALYQRIETQDNQAAGSQVLAFAGGFNHDINSPDTEANESKQIESTSHVGLNQTILSDSNGENGSSSKSREVDKSIGSKLEFNDRAISQIPKITVFGSQNLIVTPENPAVIPNVSGFITESAKAFQNQQVGTIKLQIPDNLKGLSQVVTMPVVRKANLDVATTPLFIGLDCAEMQPTMGNLVLGLNKILGLKIVPHKNIDLLMEPQVAVKYWDAICKKNNWNFDLFNFDFKKPLQFIIGKNKVVINFNKQRKNKDELGKSRNLLPASELQIDNLIQAPLSLTRNKNIINIDSSTEQNMPENLEAALVVTGLAEIKTLNKKSSWLQGATELQNKALEINSAKTGLEQETKAFKKKKNIDNVTTVTESDVTVVERVQSKIDEIMKMPNLDNSELSNFLQGDHQGITKNDIHIYFDNASIQDLLTILNATSDTNKYDLLKEFSVKALGLLFEKIKIDDLLTLLNAMNSIQKLNVLKEVPLSSLESFVNELNIKNFKELFQSMNEKELDTLYAIKISSDQSLRDVYLRLQESILIENRQRDTSKNTYNFEQINTDQLNWLEAQRTQAIKQQEQKEEIFEHGTNRSSVPDRLVPVQGYQPSNSFLEKQTSTGMLRKGTSQYQRQQVVFNKLKYAADYLPDVSGKMVKDIARIGIRSSFHGL